MIRALLYEDNIDFVDSLKELFRGTGDIELVASFSNCKNVLKDVAYYKPDIIIMDIDMPIENGLQGLRKIRAAGNEVLILMLTVFDDNDRVYQSICNGASGYILKSSQPEVIVAAIKDAINGGAPMTPSVARQVLKLFSQPFRNTEDLQTLTAREHDVLSCLVRGYSYKMAAAELETGIETIRFHIKNIYSKLHVNSKSEAVAKALQTKNLKQD